MNTPKSHHFVPKFYLARFTDARGHLHVLDKLTLRIYCTSIDNVACANNFYSLPELSALGLDPLLMERQLSDLESEVARIFDCWMEQLDRSPRVEIPAINRTTVSVFLALQTLRTIEARTLLSQIVHFFGTASPVAPPFLSDARGRQSNHVHVLWEEELVQRASKVFEDRVWVFARNESPALFYTSDHPVLVKSGDNRGWVLDKLVANYLLNDPLYSADDYFVYPLSPRWILYCFDRKHHRKLLRFDATVSPVGFSPEMANMENSGQAGMSHRFIYSQDGNFSFAKDYADRQPWICDPARDRFEKHPNPYD